MESHEIAKFIAVFNTAATVVMAVFAVCGIAAVLGRALGWGIFRKRVFLCAFCVAALAAFVFEATVFNFQHYLKWFAGPELETTELSEKNPDRLLTSEAGYSAEVLIENNMSGIYLKDIDRKITSIYVDIDFGDANICLMMVEWTDGRVNKFNKILYKGLPHENYTVIQPRGKVSELKVLFEAGVGADVNILQIALNRQIPFYFSGLRLFAVALLIFVVLVVFVGELRTKASYLLFEYKFDPASKKQNLVYAGSVVLLILFSWLCAYTSWWQSSQSPTSQQYTRFLVDAIIEGRTNLDYGEPERFLDVGEHIYDNAWRMANNIISDDGTEIPYNNVTMWDWMWYKGKYYCYMGPVPALILNVPYKLITGNYLSNAADIFLFSAVTVALLALCWRYCIKKYMPGCTFAFYLLSFLTLFFASGLSYLLRFSRSFYCIPQAAGLMFAVAGVYLLLKSVEKDSVSRMKVFFACLCLALIAGTRLNMIFVSLLVPVVLWKYRSWKLLPFVAIPYIMVAIPLCLYNYARFDSIFDFGNKYSLGDGHSTFHSLNPVGKSIQVFESLTYYLFYPAQYTLHFPFVAASATQYGQSVIHGIYLYIERGVALINYPIVFCLFYMFKNFYGGNKLKILPLLYGCLIVAVSIMIFCALYLGYQGRYTADFAIFFIIPSLFCAWFYGGDRKSVV